MKAVAYCRVSSEMQVENWSIPAQRRAIEDCCRQKGWVLTNWYIEEGKSARSENIDKRPQFKKLLTEIGSSDVDVVVVQQLDRWSRNLSVTLESFKLLASRQIAFASVTENLDYSTPEGRLFIAMIGAFAQYFSDSLAKHTSKGKKERAMQGFWNGDVAFGYTKGPDGKLQIDQVEAEGVRIAFQLYATGNYSCRDIAKALNEAGFRTKNKTRSRPFSKDTVTSMLKNPIYAGYVTYKGERFPGQHRPIIPEELWEKVASARARFVGVPRINGKSEHEYPLSGILYCQTCGQRMRAQANYGGLRYYRDKTRDQFFSCDQKGVRADLVESQIDDLLSTVNLPEDWREQALAMLSEGNSLAEFERKKRALTDRMTRLKKLYLDGDIDADEYNRERRRIQDELGCLVPPRWVNIEEAGLLLEQWDQVWVNATLKERKTLLRMILEAVNVKDKRIVSIKPRPTFRPLFAAAGKVTKCDPEGDRGIHAQWAFAREVDASEKLLWAA